MVWGRRDSSYIAECQARAWKRTYETGTWNGNEHIIALARVKLNNLFVYNMDGKVLATTDDLILKILAAVYQQ